MQGGLDPPADRAAKVRLSVVQGKQRVLGDGVVTRGPVYPFHRSHVVMAWDVVVAAGAPTVLR